MSPQRLLPRTSVAIALYAVALAIAASASLYFVNERSTVQQRAEARTLRTAAIAQCERTTRELNGVINALKIVTEGDDVPQSDIGVRLFAAIDALAPQPLAGCQTVIP